MGTSENTIFIEKVRICKSSEIHSFFQRPHILYVHRLLLIFQETTSTAIIRYHIK